MLPGRCSMSTAAVTHAVTPPAHAAAPPVQRKAEPISETQEAPQRLLTSLSSVPAVQRKCAACAGEENEDRMPVQPRLEVGPVDDPYEREADNIAGQVMAMREPAPASATGATVQRACAACSGKSDEVQRAPAEMPELIEDNTETPRMRAMAETASAAGGVAQRARAACSSKSEEVQRAPADFSGLTKDDDQTPRMRATAGNGAEHITASSSQLTSGGSSLAGPTRDFFESRMGRDLSDVRVHHGSDADALNQSISARAFTFRNHIWLSRAEPEAPSETMAHELAHVLQQTQPGPLGDQAKAQRDETVRRKPMKIFGSDPYWESKTLDGSGKSTGMIIHENLLPMFQQADNTIFYEVTLPTSTFKRTGRSSTRRADLYKGVDSSGIARTIGINFVKGKKPRSVSWSKTQAHNSTYSHPTSARPKLRGASTLVGLPEAPKTISLGELKPQGQISKGQKQLSDYESGINKTRELANQHSIDQHTDTTTPAPQWPDITYSRLNVKTPDPQKVSELSGEHDLGVYEEVGMLDKSAILKTEKFAMGKLIHDPPAPVKGKLRADKDSNGVYYYWWEPTSGLVSQMPTDSMTKLVPVSKKMMQALRSNRRVTIPALTPASAAPSGVAPKRSGNVKPFPNVFDKEAEKTWNDRQKGIAKRFKEPEKSPTITNDYMVKIDKGLGKNSKGLSGKLAASAAGQRLKDYRDLRLVSRPFARGMSKARRMFGSVFAKASELYAKIKAKFDGRAKPKNSVSGGGILGALLRVAFKVLLLIGRQIVAGTMIQLTERLKGCMTRLFESWFESEPLNAVEERLNSVEEAAEEKINTFIGGSPEELAGQLFGPYGQQVDKVRGYIEGITKAAGPVLTAYKAVKWGIQALACASPPVVGCLWGLARSAIEWAAGKLIETCWFMKEVTPKILKIQMIKNFMRDTTTTLSGAILQKGGEIFPEPIGPFLAECGTDKPKVAMPSADTICSEGSGGGMGNSPQPSEEAMKFWRRWESLPFAKQMAIKKMLGRENAKGGTTADWDKMTAMLEWAEKTDVATMEERAKKAAAGDTSAIPGPVAKLKQAVEQAKVGKGKGKARDSGPGTAADDSKGGEGGSDGEGAAEGESHYAKRLGEEGKEGKPASDLASIAFSPNSSGTPAKVGDEVIGTVVVSWTKPGSDPVLRYLADVRMTFQGADGTVTLEGKEYEKWNLKAVSSEKFQIEGREDAFFLNPSQMLSLIIIRTE